MPRPKKILANAISYHVRINQVEGVDRASIRKWLDDTGGSYLVVFEDADEKVAHPHFHIKLEVPWTVDAIKSEIRTTFPAAVNVVGGTQYHSVKLTRSEENLVLYLLKGVEPADPIVVGHYGLKNYTDRCASLYGQWHRNKAALKKERQESKTTFRQELDEEVDKLDGHPLKITRCIVEKYVEHNKAINRHHIASLATLYCAKKDQAYKRRLVKDIGRMVAVDDPRFCGSLGVGEEGEDF